MIKKHIAEGWYGNPYRKATDIPVGLLYELGERLNSEECQHKKTKIRVIS